MYLFFVNAAVILLLKLLVRDDRLQSSQGKQTRLYLILAMSYLAALAILRSYTVGSDTDNYLHVFRQIGRQTDIFSYLRKTGHEKGFVLYVWFLMRLFHEPRIIFMLSSAFMFFSAGRFFSRYTKSDWLSVYLFFTLLIFDFYLSGFRQAMAIAILGFAFDKALERRFLPFLLLVLLAMSFHSSAVIFLAVYFISRVKSDRHYVIITLTAGVAALVLWPMLLSLLLRVFPRYSYYVGDSEFGGDGKLAVFSKMAVYLVILIVGKMIRERDGLPPLSPQDQLMQRLVWLLPLLGLVSLRATVISRFFRYFEIFAAVYVPNVVVVRKSEKNRGVLAVLIVVLFFLYALVIQLLRTPEWQQTYPYTFFWQIG